MKLFFYLCAIALSFFNMHAWAEHESHVHSQDDKTMAADIAVSGAASNHCEDVIDVQVNGLACDFCARALEKVFGRRTEVSGIEVDLDRGKVSVFMQPNEKLADDTLRKLIQDSGYSVVDIEKGC